MKTLADFKRALKRHPNWTFHYADHDTDCGVQPRTVAHIQTNGVWFFMPNRGNAKTWLDFPAARHCRFPDPETLVIDYRDEWGTTLTYRMAGEPSANPNATN
ncbi:hypothetical protein [Pacificispira sp.]|uniref:hypothetical protein n=1 Tax=Pacificispira sp. TaxID=2888761 RepID=UPI003B5281CB